MTATTLALPLRDAEPLTVPAVIVGDLAVHRYARRLPNGEPELGDTWRITHVPTGLSLDAIVPANSDRTRRDTLAFAKLCAEQCADDWTVVRGRWDPLESTCRHASLSIL